MSLRDVSLDRIDSSPLNPRQHFDEQLLEELAASIRSKGVLQPVLLRPSPNGKGPESYELVAGERRVRAARLAGLEEVPAIVRELTDREVLEAMVVENEQREDVSPLEKADGYARLLEEHAVPLEELAEKVGKSASTIRGLLLLRRLPPPARKALAAGEISTSVAQLICRIPEEKLRAEAAKEILKGDWRGSYSFRETKEIIQREYSIELKRAPFDRRIEDLVNGVPSCKACPKRVGNLQEADPEAYEGARADVCTDPGCYRAKVAAWKERVAAAAKEKGRKVLSFKETAKVFPYQSRSIAHNSKYLDLAEQCWDTDRKRPPSYKQLLGGKLDDEIVVAIDPEGHARQLVPKEKAAPILKSAGVGHIPGSRSSTATAAEKKRRAEAKVQAEVTRRTVALIVEKAEERWKKDPAAVADILAVIVPGLAAQVWNDLRKEFMKRRGIEGSTSYERVETTFAKAIEGMSGAELFGVLVELALAQSLRIPAWSTPEATPRAAAVCKAFGIQRGALVRKVRVEQKPKKAAKKKAARRRPKK